MAQRNCANGLGRVDKFEFVNRLQEEENMAIVKKPPESVSRSLQLEQPVSALLDDYARFVDCTADYVANFALRKTLARDPDYKKWKAGQNGASAAKRGASPQQPGKPS
jgi:bacterioferritin (cytochrome b1)